MGWKKLANNSNSAIVALMTFGAIFSAPPDFHRTGLSSRGYYAGAEKMALWVSAHRRADFAPELASCKSHERYHAFDARQHFPAACHSNPALGNRFQQLSLAD